MPPHPGLQMPQVHNTPCLSVPGSRSSSSCAPPPRRVPIPLLPFRSRPSSGAAPFPGTKSHTNPPDTAGGLLAARTAPPNRAAKDANRRPQKSAPHAEVLPIGGAGRRRIRRRQEGRPLASFATSRWGCRHVRPPTPCRAVARPFPPPNPAARHRAANRRTTYRAADRRHHTRRAIPCRAIARHRSARRAIRRPLEPCRPLAAPRPAVSGGTHNVRPADRPGGTCNQPCIGRAGPAPPFDAGNRRHPI